MTREDIGVFAFLAVLIVGVAFSIKHNVDCERIDDHEIKQAPVQEKWE